MFTGLVEELGRIEGKRRSGEILKLLVGAKKVLEGLTEGSSIAVNGCCLTVTHLQPGRFSADVSGETQKNTTLPLLRVGERINLERPVSPQTRFGGHILTGHVDGIARIIGRKVHSSGIVHEIELLAGFAPYVVDKGSIAVDGVSLTIVKLSARFFSVSVIPYTQNSTTFGVRKVGDRVNIELDMIGKYVVSFLKAKQEFNI